jgi:ribulose-5-phosphate 4-epimerase/fuculose-1-phosphate aldolase
MYIEKEFQMSDYQLYKQQVMDTCHTLLERGYLKETEGNISARVSGQNTFAITPSNYDYAKMQVNDICILNFDMQPGVYQTRPDVHCIIHTHQPYASALALIKAPIPALFDEQVMRLGRSVEIIPYAPSGTGFLKNAVKAKIKNSNNAFMLQNHGVLVFGVTMEQAIHNMALLEKCALTYLLAIMTEKKITKIPLPIREIAFAKLRKDEKKFAEIK